mgnify:FL=1
MKNKRQQPKEYYLLDTGVENMFINEYMPMAPGEYVKVYLFALMYADIGEEMSNRMIAKQLDIQEEDVLKAWNYWEHLGLISKIPFEHGGRFDYTVEFMNLKEHLYTASAKGADSTSTLYSPISSSDVSSVKRVPLEESVAADLSDLQLEKMYNSIEKILGKTLSGTEMMDILSWIKDLDMSYDVILTAYRHCSQLKKTNVRYVAAVIREWHAKGLDTSEAVHIYLEETDQRHYRHRRIMKALGFSRNPTEEEVRLMNSWFDDMGFSMDTVLSACRKTSGISSPNMNYVNRVLANWKEESSGINSVSETGTTVNGILSNSTVMKYYAKLQSDAQHEAEIHRDEVYKKVPKIKEIEDELNRISMDISKSILFSSDQENTKLKALQDKSDHLLVDKAVLLTENDFPVDYMEVKYLCSECRDSGFTDSGNRCSCYPERSKEAELWIRKQKADREVFA